MESLLIVVFIFGLLRLNSRIERGLMAKRNLHGIILPLSKYLGLFSQELAENQQNPDPLISQAVLDHVTELRAFLLQPLSGDLIIFGGRSWVQRLNNLLLAIEESLEGALHHEAWPAHKAEIREQIQRLSDLIHENRYLKNLSEKPLGLI